MKKIVELVPRWRAGALACAAALVLAGCGAANDGGLSNGPQMAAAATDVPVDGGAAAAPAEPVAAEPAVTAPEPVPAVPATAGPAAQAAGQADSFAMTGYGGATAKPAAPGGAGSQPGASRDAGGAAEAAPSVSPQNSDAATTVSGIPAMPADAPAQASAMAVPDGGRTDGASGTGLANLGSDMCKYGSCSFR